MILHELYANCEKRPDLPIKYATRILRFNDPLQRDVLSTATGVTVKKAIFSRERHGCIPSEEKKEINDFLSFIGCCCCYASSIDEYGVMLERK